MGYESYHKRRVGNRLLRPETQMMGYGYDASLSEGALKPPYSSPPRSFSRAPRTARTSSITRRADVSRRR
jgi:hypothetical protein